ncbi:MAG: methyltransferase domain-containing protein [Bacteroidota bacterium]
MKKHEEIFQFNEIDIHLWIPDQAELQFAYREDAMQTAFPYWAKLWPAAFVLTNFLLDHPDLIKNKSVVEIAGGLGLPSLFASRLASNVICSDYDAKAVAFIEDNIALNGIRNMVAAQIDWTDFPSTLEFDLLILSDVNYNPGDFDILLKLIENMLAKGVSIILSTPQRLAGRRFVEQLIPFCVLNEEIWWKQIAVNVLVLKNQ